MGGTASVLIHFNDGSTNGQIQLLTVCASSNSYCVPLLLGLPIDDSRHLQ